MAESSSNSPTNGQQKSGDSNTAAVVGICCLIVGGTIGLFASGSGSGGIVGAIVGVGVGTWIGKKIT